jgi:beta-phosphoglucomutase-like phosphatase (HAD superfamily)
MVDAALLELEGVVFETRDLRRASLQDALVDHGFASLLDDDVVIGLSPREGAAAALRMQGAVFDDVIADLVGLRAERAFASRVATSGAALCPGALDFVRELSATTRLAIVSRARRTEVDALLRLASLAEFFAVTITADDVLDAKPSGEGHRLAVERLSRLRPLNARAAIALEDGAAGIRATHEAGIRCVAVGPLPAYVAMEADAFVPSLEGQTARSLDQISRPGREQVP